MTLDLSAGEVAAGETVTYSGVVSGAGGSAASGKVVVQKRLAGTSTWKEWRTPSLKVDGSYAVGVAMTTADRRWEFRAKKVADAANLTGYRPPGTLVVSGAVRETSSTEVTLFNIGGRGWGHGIGMSQYGAYGYAKHGWSYKSILRHYYSGISFAKTRNRTVRVLLASGQEKVRVSSGRAFKATDGTRTVSVPANTTASVTWTGSAYRVSAGGRSSTFARAVILSTARGPCACNRNQNGWPSGTGGARYRGDLKVVRSSGAFQVINHVTLESYLRGVVPRESPSSWPREALRAQAVVARSTPCAASKAAAPTTCAAPPPARSTTATTARQLRPMLPSPPLPESCRSLAANPSWPTTSRPRGAVRRTSRTSGREPRRLSQERRRSLRHLLAVPHLERRALPLQ